MRRALPKRFMASGKSQPSTCSNSTALPPSAAPTGSNVAALLEAFAHRLRDWRSAMQPGTSLGDTGCGTRASSPACSRAVMKSRNDRWAGMGLD